MSVLNIKFTLMKNELVFTKRDEILTTSLVIAEKLETAHRNILQIIRNVIADLSADKSAVKFPEIFNKSTFKDKRWIEHEMFILNKSAFSMLMMRLHSKRAIKWQRTFNQAFYEMEHALLQHQNATWIEARDNWKVARLNETDIIKEFVSYATKQGSKSANMYYMNITKMTYKALELINCNQPIREILDWIWLGFLMIAELKVIELLRYGMQEWLHYKEIYRNAKDWLQDFADLMPRNNIKALDKT